MDVQPDSDLTVPSNAARYTAWLLRDNPERWRHSRAVAFRAEALRNTVPEHQRDLLVASAWLHDIGYAEDLRRSGFHPMDGGDHLRGLGFEELASLVAHHSGARFVAEVRGLAPELARHEFDDSSLADALTTADQTVGPNGRPMSLDERMADMLRRHGPDSPNARAHCRRAPYLRQAVRRTLSRYESLTGRIPPVPGDSNDGAVSSGG